MAEICPVIPPLVLWSCDVHIRYMDKKTSHDTTQDSPNPDQPDQPEQPVDPSVEIGGPKGPEPTRFGDWEKGGRCTDF